MPRSGRALAAAILCLTMVSCAARTAPPLPAAPRYPDFPYPTVPDDLRAADGAARIDAGWRFLQNDDLRNAEREFADAARRAPDLYPARTGSGYVDLARRDFKAALTDFDAALSAGPRYVPALVGRGQALLRLGRDAEALAAFEAALAANASLPEIRRRVEVLRFNLAKQVVEEARAAATAGNLDEARATYLRALADSPGSAFLHRELGIVERRRGDAQAALAELQKAVEIDPADVASLIQIGEILEERREFTEAEATYRRAYEIDPSEAVAARVDAAVEKARLARLPAEFHAIPASPEITRGELAALIGIHLEPLLAQTPQRQVVITDAADHWAQPWIQQVAGAGVLEPFPNHTFQPEAVLRRGDLAAAVSRLLTLAAAETAAHRTWREARPAIADMPPGHLSYPAVSLAVAAGVLPLLEGGRFAVTRAVSGGEAVAAVDRVAALARESR